MKVRETSGITSEYTGTEIGKTRNHYVAARAARKNRNDHQESYSKVD